ncbi:hypothetical protein ACS6FW_00680 [Staphylococcus hominis]|uniref:hypothetical protein n=1 Tax=Staphylococcus hominis TaxID=1290 RepID=UPI000A50EC3E|nr:hypothetical protein [Staphylococcus hominis]MDO0979279.1 hypothetical protein [Staphylococcus hominis]
MQLDTHGLVPNFSYTENLSTSYNAAKQLVENAIENKIRLNLTFSFSYENELLYD